MRSLILALALAATLPSARAESLYSEPSFRALAADKRAFHKGDVLTVQILENSSAITTTDTSSKRRNALDVSAGLTDPGSQVSARANVNGEFSGGGATQRASRVLATLAVTVKDIGAHGELQIAGEQIITVNDEQRRVKVSGRVRPQDVSSDNVVVSTRIAAAAIEYTGDGHLSDRQRPSLWREFLDWLGF
jgi:flagellar L-ring protein precursor FlgH